jgi:phosphatidylglycerol:prolipoprotein diacylglycerol transferase
MRPYLIQYGGLTVASYPFLYGLGVGAAGLVLAILLHSKGVSLRRSANLFIACVISVVLGGRILYAIVYWESVRNQLGEFLSFTAGGQILYGSILLTVPVLCMLSRALKLPWREVLGAVAVSTPLGLAIGRLGCLSYGCCHGEITNLPWGVSYPKMIDMSGSIVGSLAFVKHLGEQLITSGASRSLHVHPVQIYESIAMLTTFCVLLVLWRKRSHVSILPPLFLLAYCLTRFNLEFIRVHEEVLAGMTIYQVLSILIGGLAVVWLLAESKMRKLHPMT